MNEPDSSVGSRPASAAARQPSSLESLHEQVAVLRGLFVATLMALLLLSAGLGVYLFRQVSLARRELDAAERLISDYRTNKIALIENLIGGLREYSRTHPDIVPILEKYNVRAPSSGASGPPPAAAAPAAAPAKPSK